MTRRWVWFVACSILGVSAVLFALSIPVHLRAIDLSVLKRAGSNTPGLVDRAFKLAREQRLGPARILQHVAKSQGIPGADKLEQTINEVAKQNPRLLTWGQPEPLFDVLFRLQDLYSTNRQPEPLTSFLVKEDHTPRGLELLSSSPRADIRLLLDCRTLTNTVTLSPSKSSAGQAFDVAVVIAGLLHGSGHLGLSNQFNSLVLQALQGARPERLEQVFLDLLSLGQRMDWSQLADFVHAVPDAETLRQLTAIIRNNEPRFPVIFAAVELSGNAAQVNGYLMNFGRTGLSDLSEALSTRTGGVQLLLARNQRLTHPGTMTASLVPILGSYADSGPRFAWRYPELAVAAKWFLYLVGGLFLASAVRAISPRAPYEAFLRVRGIHVAREMLFALGFLVVVLLLTEPFLSQESQKVEFPFRLRLPTVGNVAAAVKPIVHQTFMNSSLLTLLLFFVLQGLIYTACLLKLAEIRRQNLPARIKLKLLENEDHLFDAGLYLGFAGTIISLILVSLNVVAPSLMAAYSSTSFGIIFVSFFKIFNLRPLRRTLLIEAESAAAPEPGHEYAIT